MDWFLGSQGGENAVALKFCVAPAETEAKKNLSRWLTEAAAGKDVAIISGNSIIALRKVEVEPVDYTYAMREYGATPAELDRFERVVAERFQREKNDGRLMTVDQVEKELGQTGPH